MKELIEALTRAANAVAAHYEGKAPTTRAAQPEATPEKPLSEDVPALKKSRAKKEPAAHEAGVGLDDAPAKKDEKVVGGMSEEDSTKGVTDIAKLLVSKFNKPIEGKPEGFHIAKKILIEGFKVGRLSDLSHEQRVAFNKQVKEILTKEPAVV